MVLPESAVHLENGLFGSRKANYDYGDDFLLFLSSSLLLSSFWGGGGAHTNTFSMSFENMY